MAKEVELFKLKDEVSIRNRYMQVWLSQLQSMMPPGAMQYSSSTGAGSSLQGDSV